MAARVTREEHGATLEYVNEMESVVASLRPRNLRFCIAAAQHRLLWGRLCPFAGTGEKRRTSGEASSKAPLRR
jgi:hypothetical protein